MFVFWDRCVIWGDKIDQGMKYIPQYLLIKVSHSVLYKDPHIIEIIVGYFLWSVGCVASHGVYAVAYGRIVWNDRAFWAVRLVCFSLTIRCVFFVS